LETQNQKTLYDYAKIRSIVQGGSLGSEGRLTDRVNQCVDILIESIELKQLGKRPVIVLDIVEGDKVTKLHTFSEVLIKQLMIIKERFGSGILRAKIAKRRSYYTLDGC